MDTFEPLITIRDADPQEYARVIELSQEMYSSTANHQDLSQENDALQWLERTIKSGDTHVCVAYDSATQTIVASGIGVIEKDNIDTSNNIGSIKWMSTTQDFRGFGVGEQILNELMKWFKNNNVDRVQLHAKDKAIEFYTQHGFTKDGNTEIFWRSID